MTWIHDNAESFTLVGGPLDGVTLPINLGETNVVLPVSARYGRVHRADKDTFEFIGMIDVDSARIPR